MSLHFNVTLADPRGAPLRFCRRRRPCCGGCATATWSTSWGWQSQVGHVPGSLSVLAMGGKQGFEGGLLGLVQVHVCVLVCRESTPHPLHGLNACLPRRSAPNSFPHILPHRCAEEHGILLTECCSGRLHLMIASTPKVHFNVFSCRGARHPADGVLPRPRPGRLHACSQPGHWGPHVWLVSRAGGKKERNDKKEYASSVD